MTLPDHTPERAEVHADAIKRLEDAMDDQQRTSDQDQSAVGPTDELRSGTRLAAANEQVSARRAWLDYVEQGD